MNKKKILLALNGIEQEVPVIQTALKYVEILNANLTVLHVNDPDAGKVHMMMDHLQKVTRPELEKFMENTASKEQMARVKFKVICSENPVKGISEATTDYDLLVMGHHRKNTFMAAITDGTDERVSDHSACPVLLVPYDK